MNGGTPGAATHFDERPYGWVIVAIATICLALAFGSNVTVAVLVKPFEDDFGWSRAAISMAYTALTIGAAAGGLFWGSLSDRIGAKRIALFGVVALSGSLMLVGQQSQLWRIYVLYFVIGGFGFACLFTPLLALVGLWFSRRKGMAFGIVTAGGAIGQGIAPVVLQMLITASGWRDAMLYLGAGYLALMLPLLLLLRPPPVLVTSAAAVSRSDANHWGLSHRITLPWLAFAGIFCCICMAVPIVHLVPLGIGLKLSPETAAGLLAIAPDSRDSLGELVRAEDVRDPAVADAAHPPQRRVAAAADEDRHVVGVRGAHPQSREVVVLPMVFDHLARPQLAHHFDHLLAASRTLREGLAGEIELLLHPAHADAQADASPREHGGGADRLGGEEGVAHGQHVDAGVEVDPRGDRRHGADGDEGIRPGRRHLPACDAAELLRAGFLE